MADLDRHEVAVRVAQELRIAHSLSSGFLLQPSVLVARQSSQPRQ